MSIQIQNLTEFSIVLPHTEGTVDIRPHTTEVMDETVWDRYCERPSLTHLVSHGDLVVTQTTATMHPEFKVVVQLETEDPTQTILEEYPTWHWTKAARWIKECENTYLLTEVLSQERRPKVAKRIRKRLEVLNDV